MALELIFGLVNVLKCKFGDVDEAIFHDVERQAERIFYILGIQKSDLEVVVDEVIQVGEWASELIICLLDLLKNDFG
jgi:hypothetical protein